MNIEEMMQSLEIDGKTYIERYTETLEKIEKRKAEQKRETSLENLSAVHCFPEISKVIAEHQLVCLLYTSPSPRDRTRSRMPSSA